jgi:RNA polymerase sigma-70 factor (ECF subfamily)
MDAAGPREVRELFAAVEHPGGMDGPDPTDAELVGLAQAGDVQALAALLERYRASLYAVAVQLLRDRDEAGDAVQETMVVAMTRLDSLRDPAAVAGWLHRILRNTCFTYRRRSRRLQPAARLDAAALAPSPERVVEGLAVGDWLWRAIDALSPDDRVTLILRYFARCQSYESIAEVTGVPVGTVRSRLHRSRAQLADQLRRSVSGSVLSQADRERQQWAEWEDFYAELHKAPEPRTYRDTYAPDVQVSDGHGRWHGLLQWSDHEREAIVLGVRAAIVGIVAGAGVTVLEIDFTNPPSADDHCPPRATFVHHLADRRSQRLDICYV